jgi:hypothetical protein
MKKYIMSKRTKKQPPAARTPLLALICKNIHLLSCRKHNHGDIISSSFQQERHGYKENESCDSNNDDEYKSENTMVKLSLTNSLSDSSSGSVVLEEEQEEHSIVSHSSHKQSASAYIHMLHSIPDSYDLEVESSGGDDEHTEEKLEKDQSEWSMSAGIGMSTIERDWKDFNSLSFHDSNDKRTAEKKKRVKLHSEVSVHDLTKRANSILGFLLHQERSSLIQDHTFPISTPLPNKTLLQRNDKNGYTDELSYDNDSSCSCSSSSSISQGDNDDISVDHDNISTISSMTFATTYTSSSVITKASIVDLKMKKRLLEQKIEQGLQRARCSTTIIPSSVEFEGYFPNDRHSFVFDG